MSASCSSRNSSSVSHVCPVSCGMYCRGSSQIGQAPGASSAGGYCVPQALHRYVCITDEQRDALHVRRVGEHVDRPGAHEAVAVVISEALRVARERGRVTRDVDDLRCADLTETSQRLAGETRPRRIDDDDVGVAGARPEVGQHLTDVPCEERAVADRVELLVLD